MQLEQDAALLGLERTMHRARRAAGIGEGLIALAATTGVVIADRQVAGHQKHLLPVLVDEGFCGEHAGFKPQQPAAAAAPVRLVQRTRQDLLLDAARVTRGHLPPRGHVEGMEFVVDLVHGHVGHSCLSDSGGRLRPCEFVGEVVAREHVVHERRSRIPVVAAERMPLGDEGRPEEWPLVTKVAPA